MLIVAIQLPFVQQKIASAVSSALSEKLGTKVSVERVDLGLLNRLVIDDVVIYDQKDKAMLSSRRLSVKMELLPLLNGDYNVSSAQLFGTHLNLYRADSASQANYQFALDSLSTPDKKEPSKLNLKLGSLIVRDLSIDYNQQDIPLTPGRLNLHHLSLKDISAHISLRTLTPDSIDLNVRRFAMSEQSGLNIKQLSFKLAGNRSEASLCDMRLTLPGSSLAIDTVNASFTKEMSLASAKTSTTLAHATIDLKDLAPILPANVPTNHIINTNIALGGTIDSLEWQCPFLNTSDGSLTIESNGRWSKHGLSEATIGRLYIDQSLITELSPQLPANVKNYVERIGNIDMKASIELPTPKRIYSNGTVETGIGRLTWAGHTDNNISQWQASVSTDSISLGTLLDIPSLGNMAASIELTGNGTLIGLKGNIAKIQYNGYDYHNLSVNGTYGSMSINGKLDIDDPNLTASLEGETNRLATGRHVKMTGKVETITPKALNISNRWNEAKFKANVNADFTASSLADIQGDIDLNNFIMTDNDSVSFSLDKLHINANASDGTHYYQMTSDFGSILLQGYVSLATLPQSLSAIMPNNANGKRKGDNNFTISAHLTDSKWIQRLLGIDLKLDGQLKMDAKVDDAREIVEIDASAPSFAYGSASFKNAMINMRNKGDSTQCNLELTHLTAKGNPIFLNLQANTQPGGALASSLALTTDNADGGTIHTVTTLYDNDNGIREAHARVLPSVLKARGSVWEVQPCDIVYSEKRLLIDHFTMQHNDEYLTIDGIASTQLRDTLKVDFQGIDISYLLDLANFRAVKFGGKADGQAQLCQAFSNFSAKGDIAIDRFFFQQAPMGSLEAHAEWKPNDKQIELEAFIDAGPDSLTFVNGFISPPRKELGLDIMARGSNIGFVHSFTKSFLKNISGQAYGDLHLGGPLKSLNLTGNVTVSGQASVTPLGTTYTFSEDTVFLSPGTIAFRNFTVNDRDNHHGTLNGAISHTHFKNITFNLSADASNLLVYNFPMTENGGAIGGTVWADGHADMHGRPGEVLIDCDVIPSPSSVFIYNAANPDGISRQQFITWGEDRPLSSERGTIATAHKPNEAPSGAAGGASRGDLRMNLRINATPEATLRLLMDQNSGDVISLQGNGTLRASYYNKGAFQMFGTYNIEGGVYSMTIQNILKKNFSFQPGSSIVFGGDPLQAALHLKALHTVNGVSLSDLGLGNSFTSNTIRVNCLMNILGSAGEPSVEFDLEMPTLNNEEQQMIRSIITSEQELNQQVVYLLGIGRFYTQGANNASSQAYGQTELAMQSLLSGTVSSQINQLLSQVVKNDDWNFGANISTGNEGWHNAEYEGLVSGRMLTGRLLLNGQFGYRDNATQATPSFIGDFDIRYLLTPNGSLALKAYNQTNNRYFTHSSLNTQGIGIIMKKDFNGLRDLFSIRRKKNENR